MAQHTEAGIDKIIRANIARLRKPGVLTVRPGWEIAGNQLTGKSAIVATVHTKRKDLPRGAALPDSVAGIPVDVREATALQRLRAQDPAAAALSAAYGRPEDREPSWPLEREMPSGEKMTGARSRTRALYDYHLRLQPETARAMQAAKSKPQLQYTAPAGASLAPVTVTAPITVGASPDAGLAMLQTYLAGTKAGLAVSMYDFTSGTILHDFETGLGGAKTLQMVLDNPAPNPTRDQTDTQTVTALEQALAARADIARALVRTDSYASAWIYPSAYHIKVIVRDGAALWLSSGNLNNSNEPDLTHPPSTEDRDWHVIVADPGLAATFKAFLDHDYTVAASHQANEAAADATSRAVADAHARRAAEANPSPPPAARPRSGVVAAQTFNLTNTRITPLLTPDTLADGKTGQYLSTIGALIDGAQKSIWIQLQYIEASSGTGDYDALLRKIAAKTGTLDVRLIESADYGPPWVEKMKSQGVDLSAVIRLQPDVHNKGFVIDGTTAVVSSQNFSPEGVRSNRDAGLIIESPAIASYFGAIFAADWALAKPAQAGGKSARPGRVKAKRGAGRGGKRK